MTEVQDDSCHLVVLVSVPQHLQPVVEALVVLYKYVVKPDLREKEQDKRTNDTSKEVVLKVELQNNFLDKDWMLIDTV